MKERQLQLRVGLFVIVASVILGTIVFYFGEFRDFWEPRYTIAVHFPSAPGIFADSPVEMNGVKIGVVREIVFDQRRGGVTVLIDVNQRYQLRQDTQPQLTRSLLGDSTIEFSPGSSPERLTADTLLEGKLPRDPLEMVQNLNESLSTTLESFETTSREWRHVAQNVNSLLDTNRGQFDAVIEGSTEALAQLTATMTTANQTLSNVNRLLADPESQKNLQETMAALPRLTNETHQTIAAVRKTVETLDLNLKHLNEATAPLADRGTAIVTKLDASLGNIQVLSGELSRFAQLAMKDDGPLKQLASNPELYRNLNQSATSLAVLLKNLEPMVSDLRVFSDKIARHPELIGVSGALKGSSGLKEASSENASQAQAPQRHELLKR